MPFPLLDLNVLPIQTVAKRFRLQLETNFLDVVTIIGGCSEIVTEISTAPENVRIFITETIADFLKTRDFLDALPGQFKGDVDGVRQKIVQARLREIAAA